MLTIFSRIGAGALSTALAVFAGVVSADEPTIVLQEDVAWRSIGSAGAQMALLTGDPTQPKQYSVMVKVPNGTFWQPDTLSSGQRITIVSGTLVWSSGQSFEDGSMTALAPGGFWSVPSVEIQRGWAWNGDVIAVVTATGPTDILPLGSE